MFEKIKGVLAFELSMEEHTTLRIRTPPPDEVMDERHRRRKQPCCTRLLSRIEEIVRVMTMLFVISVMVTVLFIGWARIYTGLR
jgi:hypothetical protein